MLSKCFRSDFFEYDAWANAIIDVQYCVESNEKKVSIYMLREIYSFDVFDVLKLLFLSNDLKFCLHRCDESTIWLTEIENRMSNSNWSQRFLFWTNWTQLNLRRSRFLIDWLINIARRRYFDWYVIQVLFELFLSFSRMIFLLYRDFDVSNSVYFLKALRWCFRLYNR